MRRVPLWLTGLMALLLAAGCAAGATTSATTAGHARQPGQAAGLAITVPPGWRAIRFSESRDGARAAGIQLSNLRLPRPTLLPGFPVQASGEVLPPRGVALVIATDADRRLAHGKVAALPLPLPWPDGSHGWLLGSSSAYSPVFESLWFRAGHTTYLATAKIGWKASGPAQRALGQIVRSIRRSQAPGLATAPGSPPAVRPATVTGVAEHCAGAVQRAPLPVRLTARSDGRTVASELVRYGKDHGRYRLSLPPGRYVISARGSADPARAVTLRPGERIVVSFPDRCL